jgi:diguanylate cyclase (GGDEF)-like protein
MYIDLKTLFLLTVDIEAMLGLLLLFVWVQNTENRAIAWWGCAHLLRSLSIALYSMYGSVSDLVSIGLADAILFGSYAVTWSGTRVFDAREPRPGSLIAGATVWLLACQFSGFAQAADLRAVLSSAIIATFMWLAAYELWRGRSEGLISRWPAILIFFAQGALFLLRTPLNPLSSLTISGGAGSSAWITVMSTEVLLATISSAFILVAMAKERVELARQDSVTGLANRYLFRKRLHEQLNRVSKQDLIAVHCIDLDCFKEVNNAFGHPIGDLLLRAVAKRLNGVIRKVDTAARLGGDEFAIVQPLITSKEQAVALARRLIEVICKPYRIDGHDVLLSGSVGVAIASSDKESADRLLNNADIALYCAKADGRGTYRFFEPEMDARLHARRTLELSLRTALSKQEFEVYYQPIINLNDNTIASFEALIRWHHPERGMISPAEFIPLAEEIGLIVPLGEWIIHKACVDAAQWPENVKVAVNLSPIQLMNPDLMAAVANALAASGLAPRRLEFEITEAVLMQNTEVTIAALHRLRDLGVHITMDDFGIGYSSLSYLRSFPFEKIKIDRSFVKGLGEGEESAAIVRAVAGLAQSLKMTTTAEGVETEQQMQHVRALGCTEMQGFLFSPPVCLGEVARLFDRQVKSKREAA